MLARDSLVATRNGLVAVGDVGATAELWDGAQWSLYQLETMQVPQNTVVFTTRSNARVSCTKGTGVLVGDTERYSYVPAERLHEYDVFLACPLYMHAIPPAVHDAATFDYWHGFALQSRTYKLYNEHKRMWTRIATGLDDYDRKLLSALRSMVQRSELHVRERRSRSRRYVRFTHNPAFARVVQRWGYASIQEWEQPGAMLSRKVLTIPAVCRARTLRGAVEADMPNARYAVVRLRSATREGAQRWQDLARSVGLRSRIAKLRADARPYTLRMDKWEAAYVLGFNVPYPSTRALRFGVKAPFDVQTNIAAISAASSRVIVAATSARIMEQHAESNRRLTPFMLRAWIAALRTKAIRDTDPIFDLDTLESVGTSPLPEAVVAVVSLSGAQRIAVDGCILATDG